MLTNKSDRLIRLAIGEVFVLLPRSERRYRPLALPGIWIEIAGWLAEVAAPDVEVEALLVGIPVIGAEVPFADMTLGVSGRLQRLGNGSGMRIRASRDVLLAI